MSDIPTYEEQAKHFDELGEPRVRDLALQWPPGVADMAYRWLKSREAEREASQREQASEARLAARDARLASKAAHRANMIAAAGIIIAVLSWLFPRR